MATLSPLLERVADFGSGSVALVLCWCRKSFSHTGIDLDEFLNEKNLTMVLLVGIFLVLHYPHFEIITNH